MFKLLVLSVFVVACNAFTCQDVQVQQNFDMEKFKGRWDVNYYGVPIELPIEINCMKLEYLESQSPDSDYIMDMSIKNIFGGGAVSVLFDLLVPNPLDQARWITRQQLLPQDVDMFVLYADVEQTNEYQFAMYGTCFDDPEIGPGFGEIAIFSRNHTEMTDSKFEELKTYLEMNYGVVTPWLTIPHNECPQWKEE